jgi:N6-adenosine-specific RNA methylase IME4
MTQAFPGLWPRLYGVILADPPWRFESWDGKDAAKGPGGHYGLMGLDDIKALPVAELAADDCVCVMWAVQAMVPAAFDLMEAWGFTPKTTGAWLKLTKNSPPEDAEEAMRLAFGTGYIFRSAAEFYVYGTRGKPKQAVKNVRNAIVAPVREHSRKPDQMHADLERMFPGVAKVELFARQRRPGWDCWGNQTERFG